jgi:hypothetical protein
MWLKGGLPEVAIARNRTLARSPREIAGMHELQELVEAAIFARNSGTAPHPCEKCQHTPSRLAMIPSPGTQYVKTGH